MARRFVLCLTAIMTIALAAVLFASFAPAAILADDAQDQQAEPIATIVEDAQDPQAEAPAAAIEDTAGDAPSGELLDQQAETLAVAGDEADDPLPDDLLDQQTEAPAAIEDIADEPLPDTPADEAIEAIPAIPAAPEEEAVAAQPVYPAEGTAEETPIDVSLEAGPVYVKGNSVWPDVSIPADPSKKLIDVVNEYFDANGWPYDPSGKYLIDGLNLKPSYSDATAWNTDYEKLQTMSATSGATVYVVWLEAIDKIYLDVAKPAQDVPATTKPNVTVPSGADYGIDDVYWATWNGTSYVPATGTVKPHDACYVFVNLRARFNHGFDTLNPPLVTVNSSDGFYLEGTEYVGTGTFYVVLRGDAWLFEDCAPSAWFMTEGGTANGWVGYVNSNGLMTGYRDDDGVYRRFGPNDPITRGQVVTILHRWGNPLLKDTIDPAQYATTTFFPDVHSSMYYTAAINGAYYSGIVTGYGDTGLFKPDQNITREELATIIWRFATKQLGPSPATAAYMKGDPTKFNSMPDKDQVSDWAYDAMVWCADKGIIGGGGELRPHDTTTRAEAAKMLTVLLRDILTHP